MNRLEKAQLAIKRASTRYKNTCTRMAELNEVTTTTELLRFIALRLVNIEGELKCLNDKEC